MSKESIIKSFNKNYESKLAQNFETGIDKAIKFAKDCESNGAASLQKLTNQLEILLEANKKIGNNVSKRAEDKLLILIKVMKFRIVYFRHADIDSASNFEFILTNLHKYTLQVEDSLEVLGKTESNGTIAISK